MVEQYSSGHQETETPPEHLERGVELARKMNESNEEKKKELQKLLQMLLSDDRVSNHPDADKEDVVNITARIREIDGAIETNNTLIATNLEKLER